MSEALPKSKNIDDILARLMALHPKRIDLTLDRMWRILAALDHPEKRLPPVIHVAGTNGKGSTIAFMRAILEAAGLRVHVYTSPHLVRMNERFRLGHASGGQLVSDADLSNTLERCEAANGNLSITVFEMETAAALLLFAENPADVLLLEVGLGGRLDATNVIDAPLASVIAPIAMDHLEFLGDSLIKIATEKAGIIRRNIPVISAMQEAELMAVLEQSARKMRAPLFNAGQEWSVGSERGRLVYQDEDGLLDLPAPRLFGRHQIDNAGLAIATLRAIKSLDLAPDAFEQGLQNADWPARMQHLSRGALVNLAPNGAEVWLDGGHNAHGGAAAAAAIADLEDRVQRPLVVIAGMLSNKDVAGFLNNFTGLTRHIIAISIPDQPNALPADQLARIARDLGMRVDVETGVAGALRRIAALAWDVPPRILIAGSLYLAGHVLAENGTPPI